MHHRSTPPDATLTAFSSGIRRPYPTVLAATLFLLAIGSVCPAQNMTVADAGIEAVVVESAAVSAEVTGQVAVTTFDLVFRNPNNRQLEGTFEFPLLDGQRVIRFALDIAGVLREGVPVEKERGRVVFEQIERRRVDPGLLEQTAGNNYRARIFPLPARGTRRIVIACQETLLRDADGNPTSLLPLDFPTRLDRFSLALSVHTSAGAMPAVTTTLPFTLPSWSSGHTLCIEKENVKVGGMVEIALPPVSAPAVFTQRIGDREYFCAELPLPFLRPVDRPAPKVVGIVWDASGSGRQRDHAREFAFLDAWFRAVPDVAVKFVCIRDRATAAGSFQVERGNWSNLRSAIKRTVYDGATSFDGLADDDKVDEWILFSDGILNYGPAKTSREIPLSGIVHAVSASPRADTTFLRSLAERHGGEFADLCTQEPAAAATRVRTQSARLLAIDNDPETSAHVFPEPGAAITGSTLVVAGLLRAPEASITIQVGHNDRDANTLSLTVQSGMEPGNIAARAWATAKIASLSIDAIANRNDIRRTSQEFGIVTPDTSLIVLETVWDYITYDIVPPEELRAEWTAHRTQQGANRAKGRENHLAMIAAQYAQKKRGLDQPKPAPVAPPPVVPVPPRPASPPQQAPAPELEPVAESFRLNSSPDRTQVGPARAVAAPDRRTTPDPGPDDEIIDLSPFEITASSDVGYYATSTLSGSRIRTTLPDLVSAVSASRADRFASTTTTSRDESNDNSSDDSEDATDTSGATVLQPWSPEAGYLDRLARTSPRRREAVYLEERVDHEDTPGFFLDVAGFFLDHGEPDLALRVLSNLAELELEDPALLRVLAHRLMQAGRPDLAMSVFEAVLRMRAEEPQSYRDLALACSATGQFQRAVDLLWTVVERTWDNRFQGVGLIALGELNAIAATCGQPLDLSRVDARLRENIPAGLRVVLTWDTDNCDIDLWVDDPTGERAMYNHPATQQGGRMSADLTGGYGPEEFILTQPLPGKYTVRINYYGDSRNTQLGPVTAQVRIITGFGTEAQKEQVHTLRLQAQNETLVVGSIEIGSPQFR